MNEIGLNIGFCIMHERILSVNRIKSHFIEREQQFTAFSHVDYVYRTVLKNYFLTTGIIINGRAWLSQINLNADSTDHSI